MADWIPNAISLLIPVGDGSTLGGTAGVDKARVRRLDEIPLSLAIDR